jgi:hypothetical protein
MALSAQDKILYVANKLGLATLKDMQGSTGAVYDTDINNSGVLFGNASQHAIPADTNVNSNKFEVNEALLVETISFYTNVFNGESNRWEQQDLYRVYGPTAVVVFDLLIGNKVVMKDTPVHAAGSPLTFASAGFYNVQGAGGPTLTMRTRHQIYMEGAGILIPPQVEYSIVYNIYDNVTGNKIDAENKLSAYLYGTSVLLNFNTSI